MANIKSQIKRNRQNETRHQRNRAVKTSLKTSTKKVHVAIADADAEAAAAHQAEAARATAPPAAFTNSRRVTVS